MKENWPDIRNTKVLDLVNALSEYKVNVDVVDPLANKESCYESYGVNLFNEILVNKKYSIIIVAVAHDYFMRFDYNL